MLNFFLKNGDRYTYFASVGGQAVGYDANGNTTTMNGETYHYDSFNRLHSAGGMTYVVNPEGQRLRKSGTLGTTDFAPDKDGLLLAEHPDSGWVDYVYLGGRLIGRIAANKVDAVATDQVGRPEAVTNPSKSIIWQAQNNAFNRSVTTNDITLNLGFPGQYYDADTGLWYNGFRDYDAQLGRYIESDPSGLEGGLNTYIYSNDSPILGIDPLGLKCSLFQQITQKLRDLRTDTTNAAIGFINNHVDDSIVINAGEVVGVNLTLSLDGQSNGEMHIGYRIGAGAAAGEAMTMTTGVHTGSSDGFNLSLSANGGEDFSGKTSITWAPFHMFDQGHGLAASAEPGYGEGVAASLTFGYSGQSVPFHVPALNSGASTNSSCGCN